MTNYSHPVDAIIDTYDKDDLHNIAMHGCSSGCASSHIYTSDCVEFFDAYEFQITDYIEEELGHESAFELAVECKSIQEIKQHLSWIFIELVATSFED